MSKTIKTKLKDEDLRILDVKKPKTNFIEVHPNLPLIPSITLFISPPASGKSLLLINFLYRFYKNVFEEVYWFSPTLNMDNTLDSSVKKDDTIIKISDAEDLLKINSFIAFIIKSQADKDNDKRENILIVFDDCMAFINGKKLLELCTQFRHLKITIWISIQKVKLLNNTIRACATNAITFAIANKKQRAAFFEEFDSFPDIEEYYEQCTSKLYNWMRLDLKHQKIFHGGPDGIVKLYEKT